MFQLFKKSVVTCILTLSLIGTYGVAKSDAASISATPSYQDLNNAYDRAEWTLYVTGETPYHLSWKKDSNASYVTIESDFTGGSRYFEYWYDLGALSSKYWYPTFRLLDYWGTAASDDATVYHRRYSE